MKEPKLLEFFNYQTFLHGFAQWKKTQSSSWSLGVWSRSLGLSGTASISRVINGDRLPGDDLIQTLIGYFNFSKEEENYFRRLVQKARFYSGNTFASDAALVIRSARNLDLVGFIDEECARKILAPLSLEPLLFNSKVIASININTYPWTSYGPYNESHVCITAKTQGGGLVESGLFFDGFTCDELLPQQNLQEGWQHKYRLEEIKLLSSEDRLEATLDDREVFSMSLKKDFSRIEEKYELFGYSRGDNGLLQKAKFSIDTIGRECPFDAEADRFNLEANPAAFELLRDMNFQPLKWVLHENLFSLVHLPLNTIAKGSY